jgi:Zinc-finger of the MIZ type in Nse subunit
MSEKQELNTERNQKEILFDELLEETLNEIKDEDSEGRKCPISMEKIKEPYALTCGHVFEKKNIDEWLGRSNRCPVCNEKQPSGSTGIPSLDGLFNMKKLSQQMQNITDDDTKIASQSLAGILGSKGDSEAENFLSSLVGNIVQTIQTNPTMNMFDVAESASKNMENNDVASRLSKNIKSKFEETTQNSGLNFGSISEMINQNDIGNITNLLNQNNNRNIIDSSDNDKE